VDQAAALEWASKESLRLLSMSQNAMSGVDSDFRGETLASVEFLRLQAPRSTFFKAAERASHDNRYSAEGLSTVSASLRGWVDFIQLGLVEVLPFEVLARTEAATDLMEQVQRLLESREVHPAAPVVLAGAALEEHLRALVLKDDVRVTGTASINSYAQELRKADLITSTDVKDITAWAGQRNDAAHGHFDRLDPMRAQVMADGINLFIRQHLL
jgi:hypothetical protein